MGAIALNYTSGTGNPKGVVYHHRGAALCATAMPCRHHGRHPVLLWTLPMFLQPLVHALAVVGGSGTMSAALGRAGAIFQALASTCHPSVRRADRDEYLVNASGLSAKALRGTLHGPRPRRRPALAAMADAGFEVVLFPA
jgi:acyl-coenzyme A synthetase/AMP-(fatty) acid ligase